MCVSVSVRGYGKAGMKNEIKQNGKLELVGYNARVKVNLRGYTQKEAHTIKDNHQSQLNTPTPGHARARALRD